MAAEHYHYEPEVGYEGDASEKKPLQYRMDLDGLAGIPDPNAHLYSYDDEAHEGLHFSTLFDQGADESGSHVDESTGDRYGQPRHVTIDIEGEYGYGDDDDDYDYDLPPAALDPETARTVALFTEVFGDSVSIVDLDVYPEPVEEMATVTEIDTIKNQKEDKVA